MPAEGLGITYDHTPAFQDSRYAVYAAHARTLLMTEVTTFGAALVVGSATANIEAVKTLLSTKKFNHVGQCEQGVGWNWGPGKDKGNENQQSDKLELDFVDKNATIPNEKAAMQIRNADLDIVYIDELNLEVRFYLNIPNSLKRAGKGGEKKKMTYHLELDTPKPENYEAVFSLA